MKIRDLLRKVVNNEELPLKVKICNRIYEYDYTTHEYECNDPIQRDANEYYQDALFIFCWSLDQKVEIIEEEQDIEELDGSIGYLSWNSEAVVLTNKINELIKEVNELKKNER